MKRLFDIVGGALLFIVPLCQARTADKKSIQMAIHDDPVLTDQMRIPVNYQFLRPPKTHWEGATVKSGESPTLVAGCLRFSTGNPAVTKYYILESSHRYAFVAKGHEIVLTYNKERGKGLVTEASSSDPACVASGK